MPDTTLPHIVFFRRSEVTLFFEGAATAPDNRDLLSSLRGAGIPVSADSPFTGPNLSSLQGAGILVSADFPFSGPNGDRPPLILRRGGQPIGVLQTVNLDTWISEDQRRKWEEAGSFADLSKGYIQVRDVITTLLASVGSDTISWGGLPLAEVSPNWLSGAACGGWDPGPGGRPVPPRSFGPQGRPRFRRSLRAGGWLSLWGLLFRRRSALEPRLTPDRRQGDKVRVAIFDTWPSQLQPAFDPLGRIAANPSVAGTAATPSPNLADIASGAIIPAGRIANPIGTSFDGGLKPFPYGSAAKAIETPYDLSDHGLFVADIIHDIAPRAEISVYRVLTDQGIGDTDVLLRAVQTAIDDAHENHARLVLNLSLGTAPQALLIDQILHKMEQFYLDPASLLTAVQDLHQNSPSRVSAAAPGKEPDPTPEVDLLERQGLVDPKARKFKGVLGVIDRVFRLDQEDGVLAVAAAGNDSWGDGDRFTPRLPAAVEGVLAVSAVAGAGLQASSYSNIDDFFTDNDGLSAYGGEVEVRASDGQVYTTAGNALVGLYSGSELPPGVARGNPSGLAEWSGTSFATPIAAGIAACIWSEDPTKSAAEIRTALLNIANSYPGDVLPYIQH
jgi:hypothetical protein